MKSPIEVDKNWAHLTDNEKFILWCWASTKVFYPAYGDDYDARSAELDAMTSGWNVTKVTDNYFDNMPPGMIG